MPDPRPGRGPGQGPGQIPPPGSEGRRRLTGALRHPSRRQLVVAVLLAFLGFAAVTQVGDTQRGNTYAGYRQQELIDVLNGLASTSQRAEREITRLERTRDELLTTTNAREAARAQAEEEAQDLSILAGVVPVTGPGVRITIENVDGEASIDSLLDLIQELRTAGAEAMEFNDQVRVVAQTALEVGRDGVYVDGEPVRAPYVLDVVGEPSTLAGAVTFFQGPGDSLAEEGASVEVEELDDVVVESVREATAPEYAEPDPGQ